MKCEVDGCVGGAVYHISWIQTRRCYHEQHLCDEHAESVLGKLDRPQEVGSEKSAHQSAARNFDIDLLIISEVHDQQAVYLREIESNRCIPILIGIFEATALDRNIKGFRAPRPLTHDALLDAIHALDGEIEDIVIADLQDHT